MRSEPCPDVVRSTHVRLVFVWVSPAADRCTPVELLLLLRVVILIVRQLGVLREG